jgi:4-hydroxy-tetrahydrodipicolinate synthase
VTAAPAIHGIIAYPITPFGRDGGVDTATLITLLEKLVGAGVHAIAPLGSTGEAAYLTEDEFDRVVDTTVNTVGHRVPVIVGASDLTTANTVRRARYAQHAGADAVMILPVSYWKLSTREIAQHYATVAAALDIPFTEIDNLTMVKESTGDLDRMLRIKELTGNTLPFYNGSNPLILDALTAGASGWCTAAPNLRPQPCLDLYAATQAGDYAAAKAIYEDLSPLLRFIVAGGLPTTVKAGLNLLGTHVGDPRPPLLPLDEAGLDEMRSLLID